VLARSKSAFQIVTCLNNVVRHFKAEMTVSPNADIAQYSRYVSKVPQADDLNFTRRACAGSRENVN
jgi:hypothetical protein